MDSNTEVLKFWFAWKLLTVKLFLSQYIKEYMAYLRIIIFVT